MGADKNVQQREDHVLQVEMSLAIRVVAIYLIAVNVMAFAAYGIDKRRARLRRWRIPESVLLLLAIVGGPLGAVVGMKAFHHKTQHRKFMILIPLLLMLWCMVLAYAVWVIHGKTVFL